VQNKWVQADNIIFPNQNDRGAHVNISGAAVTKSARNRENAVLLIEYLSGATAQKIYAERNFEYPVKAGVAPHPLVASWGTFKVDKAHLAKIASERARASKMMDRVSFNN